MGDKVIERAGKWISTSSHGGMIRLTDDSGSHVEGCWVKAVDYEALQTALQEAERKLALAVKVIKDLHRIQTNIYSAEQQGAFHSIHEANVVRMGKKVVEFLSQMVADSTPPQTGDNR